MLLWRRSSPEWGVRRPACPLGVLGVPGDDADDYQGDYDDDDYQEDDDDHQGDYEHYQEADHE